MVFKDYFSKQSSQYSQFRPTYPPELYRYLNSLVSAHDCAWDCGTGNGQAAVALAEYFDTVIATDASDAQINNAIPHPHVNYQTAPAEKTAIANHSIDLITVAQALHWFNLDAFYEEVRRVAKPTAILAVWCYPLMQFQDKAIQKALNYFYNDILGNYWPPERQHCDSRYQNIPFPFAECSTPTFELALRWSRSQLIGYMSTWSSVQRYKNEQGEDPIQQQMMPLLEKCWGSDIEQPLRFEFVMRAGRVDHLRKR